jgi:hypothetical protein
VEDGTWEIQGWIAEHCQFPMGKLNDRVDSASGAFAKLATSRAQVALRVFTLGRSRKQKTLRILVGSRQQLASTVIEQRRLLVTFSDPAPLGKPDPQYQVSDQLLGSLVLTFADLDPADLQEKWGELIPPYDRTADQLTMTRELGKKLWSFLLRQRDPAPEVIVLQDEGDRRAISLAYAICDSLRLERSTAIYKAGQEWSAHKNDVPPNRHVYEMTKQTRTMVV